MILERAAAGYCLNLFVAVLILVGAGDASATDPAKIDWGRIEATKLVLFYPGQASYEWLRSEGHKGANREVTRGEACTFCHDEEWAEQDLGDAIVKGGRLEPSPVKGKNGWLGLSVQAAFDEKNAYLRFQWKTNRPAPGTEHQYLRFDGKTWQVWGYPKLDKVVQDGLQPGIYEDRVSIMIDDGKVPGFAKQGCWLTCHDGMRDMPKQPTMQEVAANPLLRAINKPDVRKYLPDSRQDPSDWKTGKSVAEIAKLKTDGRFLDLVQWRAHRSNSVGMASDGYVLEWRHGDSGKDMFDVNADPSTGLPRYMWDAKKMGFRSITEQSPARRGDLYLDRTQNAVPFDPRAEWKAGDMMPDYIVSREDAMGSAADNNAIASWANGMWTVVMIRPLGLSHADDKLLQAGGVYNVGFAVHDDNINTRGHHVSFVKTLGMGVKADVQAVRLP